MGNLSDPECHSFLSDYFIGASSLSIKMKRSLEWKAHINTRKLHWNISTITDIFLDQKIVNVCEHMVKIVPCDNQVVLSLLCVHIHLLSSDQQRHLWLPKHFSEVSMCLCVPFIQISPHFFGKSFLFLFLFLCYL